ncbi:uncharacterized protein PFL1_03557 [Pseudozyma flocculosa PF-1]|uniref:Related to enoyl-CoA hydratase n=2 Tax=Pseudozyma flocculosa TaxID=84751 RepID=A0A5C3F7U4_9BASI|nr:uncharacterized protein PFL1_03557 [Pseudozyma flocculosa PF-1]EPQ28754.1 hypothetical protein PFL1_03557 [Pseudozyma flocculosa PF-1]SPO39469.1 related to enoyl-CoA hydratase [Pseudozyma flocculosa]
MSSSPSLPKVGSHLVLSLPAPHVFQMTLNRPQQLNAMTDELEVDIRRSFDFFEHEPSLWIMVLTGNGRAFCAGQDLKNWLDKNRGKVETVLHPSGQPMQAESEYSKSLQRLHQGGFGALSTRRSTKPIIAAVDGICMGGGAETLVNCDIVVASQRSVFAFPEVKRGVVAAMGGIPRLSQLCGHQRASELLLLGHTITAQEAHDRYNMINRLVPVEKSAPIDEGQKAVEAVALDLARQMTENSPDSLFATKEALVLARDAAGDDIDASARAGVQGERSRLLNVGQNIAEGLEAFKNKRAPRWFNPAKAQAKL